MFLYNIPRMQKIILTKEQIYELVSKNRYPVDNKTKFSSRCIDGRYPNKLKSQISKLKEINLPALAFPGADVGELALLYATANVYGFEIDGEKALKSLVEIIGGEKNFGLHTDHHADPKKVALGCGHWKQINLDPDAYKLKKDQIDFIQKKLQALKKKKVLEIILEGEHLEGAVLIVQGHWGVLPRHRLQFDVGVNAVQVFVYHQSLVDVRHRILAEKLIEKKATKLFNGCDEEYLYQVLSEMAENHLMETAKRLAKGLPIYAVKFEDDGGFDISEMGKA